MRDIDIGDLLDDWLCVQWLVTIGEEKLFAPPQEIPILSAAAGLRRPARALQSGPEITWWVPNAGASLTFRRERDDVLIQSIAGPFARVDYQDFDSETSRFAGTVLEWVRSQFREIEQRPDFPLILQALE